ncbi:MAG: PAS domain S-box protein [Verrucomicrobiota bacterium]
MNLFSNSDLTEVLRAIPHATMIFQAIRNEEGGIRDFQCVFANSAAARLFDTSEEELHQHTFFKIFPEVSTNGGFEQYIRLMTDEEQIEAEHLRITAGKKHWIKVAGVKSEDGFIATLTDIDTLKKSADYAHRMNDFYLRILDDAPVLIWKADPDGQRHYFNATWLAFTGKSLEQETGNGWMENIHPEDRESYQKYYHEALQEKRFFRTEYRLRHHTGEYRWIIDVGRPFYDIEQAFQGYVGYCFDVHESHIKDEALCYSEEKFKSILNALPAGIIIIDPLSHTIMEVNPEAEALTGLTRDQMVGRKCTDTICSGDACIYPFVKESQPLQQRECFFNNAAKPLLKTAMAIHLNGKPYLMETFVDISEIKHTEEKLQKALTEIEAHKNELENLNLQLAAAVEQANQHALEATLANQAKSSFLATMSHEIRTPMNGVLGMTQVLMETPLNEKQKEYVQVIHNSGEILLGIIDDILDYSKLESGKLELESIPFEPKKMIDDVLRLMSLKSEEKGLLLQTSIDSGLPQTVIGDPLRLKQVLLNFVNNAIKFTEKGKVSIEVNCVNVCDSIAVLRFTVHDTGIGIEESAKEHLFQEFQQADSSITRRFGGTGLGLAICKKITRLMNAELGVNSVYGHGSSFWIQGHFPIATTEQIRAQEMEQKDSFVSKNTASLRILLVEDNPVNRMVVQAMLQKEGHQVFQATNGIEAVEAVKNNDFDVILMDIHMPEMDGIQATHAIRSLPEKKASIYIIALTASVMSEDKDQLLENMNAYLSKPVTKKVLLAALAKVSQPVCD